MSIKSFIGLSDTSIKSVSNTPIERIKTILGSGLNQSNITDTMMEEDVDYYMASEDEADVYLQLVEE